MRDFRRVLIFILFILVLSSLNFASLSSASDNPGDQINAVFTINFKEPTLLDIEVTINVDKITVMGGTQTYLGSEIKNVGPETIGMIKENIRTKLKKQIGLVFYETTEDAYDDITAESEVTHEGNNVFSDNFEVKLNSEFFGIRKNVESNNLIKSVLDMGGKVDYTLDLQAEPGWTNTYNIILNSYHPLKHHGEYTDASEFHPIITNQDGEKTKVVKQNLSLKLEDATTPTLSSEDIFVKYYLDSKDMTDTSLNISLLFRNVDIKNYDFLPKSIKLDFIPADGVRFFNELGLLNWSDFKTKTVGPIMEEIKEAIESSEFDQILSLSFKWNNATTTECKNPYDINNMDNKSAIKAEYTDEKVDLRMLGITDKAFYGLINSGGIPTNFTKEDINFGENLWETGYNYEIIMMMPGNITLQDKNPYVLKRNETFSGSFDSKDAKHYNKENKEIFITIDIKEPSLNLLSFVTGKTQLEFNVNVEEINQYYVLDRNTSGFTLPSDIKLDYLCADAFRLCVQENVFNESDIDDFLKNEKTIFKNRVKNIWIGSEIGKNTKVEEKSFKKSIFNKEINIQEMENAPSVKVNTNADFTKPLPFDLDFIPPNFDIKKQNYELKGLEGHNVTYKIIFPKGLSLDTSNELDKNLNIDTTKDGRKYVTMSFNKTESNLSDTVSCKLKPSGLFVLGVFTPCIVSFVVAVILILVIMFLRRKRRGGRTKASKRKPRQEEPKEEGVYEDEDFYMPPPPGSKK
ncbi:MAG: hypothetical protein V5A64_00165 [Candidatus Thermoplasmatota archaeon]